MSATAMKYAESAEVEIRVRGLSVAYDTPQGSFDAVHEVDLDIIRGTITAIIGESGSGKSTLAMGMLNSVNAPGKIRAGAVHYADIGDLQLLRPDDLRKFRGEHAAMVFQAAQDSLNPLRRVGMQLVDMAKSHNIRDRHQVLNDAAALAERMSLPKDVLTRYQHELSGGMRQRVGMIFALVLKPKVVLLDEPTTALDVLSQFHVLEIVRGIHRERHLTTVIITHDMGVVAELADRVIVMYAGRIVEDAPVAELLRQARHPYAQGLIRAIPRMTGPLDVAQPLSGSPPTLQNMPEFGCVFRDRCPLRFDRCETEEPELRDLDAGHRVACHLEVES